MFVLKSKAIPKIKGGMSQILVACLDACWDTQGHEFRWAGVRLQLHSGQDLHVWAELGGVIADEEALHVSFANKGHAGWRPCMLCRNVYLQRLTREPGPHDVPHTCTRFRDLRMHTTETHQTIARMLADRARGRKAALEDAETEVGWNFVPDSILWNPRWRDIASPSKSVFYDFMHIYFASWTHDATHEASRHHRQNDGRVREALDVAEGSRAVRGQGRFRAKAVRFFMEGMDAEVHGIGRAVHRPDPRRVLP